MKRILFVGFFVKLLFAVVLAAPPPTATGLSSPVFTNFNKGAFHWDLTAGPTNMIAVNISPHGATYDLPSDIIWWVSENILNSTFDYVPYLAGPTNMANSPIVRFGTNSYGSLSSRITNSVTISAGTFTHSMSIDNVADVYFLRSNTNQTLLSFNQPGNSSLGLNITPIDGFITLQLGGVTGFALEPAVADGVTPYVLNTTVNHTTGDLLALQSGGSDRFKISSVTGWTGTGANIFSDAGNFTSTFPGATITNLVVMRVKGHDNSGWTWRPTGTGTADAGSSNIIISLPTGMENTAIQNSEDIFAVGETAGANMLGLFQSTNIYNIGYQSGWGANLTNVWGLINFGSLAGAGMWANDLSEAYNFGLSGGFNSRITNSSVFAMNIGDNAGVGQVLRAVGDAINIGYGGGRLQEVTNSTFILNLGDSTGQNATHDASYDVFNYGYASGNDTALVNSTNIFNYGSQAGASITGTNLNDVYTFGAQPLYGAGLINTTNLYAYGTAAGLSLSYDGLSDIYLFGSGSQPTRRTNEFVFGDANYLTTIPGHGAFGVLNPPRPIVSSLTNGGSIAVGTYYYTLTALDAIGETTRGPETAVTLATTSPAGLELLVNPGFEEESTNFKGWTVALGNGAIAVEHILVYNLAFSAKLSAGTSSSPDLEQVVTVKPGTNYIFSFYTRGDGANAGRYFVYDQTHSATIIAATSTGVTGTTYTLVSAAFTAPAGCVSVKVEVIAPPNGTGGIAYFDLVSLREVANGVSLAWNPIPGATSYKLYRSTVSGTYSTPSLIVATAQTAYVDTAASASVGAPPAVNTSTSGIAQIGNTNGWTWPPSKSGGNCVVLAAFDASQLSRWRADVTCTGTSDEIPISQAIRYLSTIGGGVLQFTEGTFNVDQVAINHLTNITLRGVPGSTILKLPAGTERNWFSFTDCSFITIDSITFDGQQLLQAANVQKCALFFTGVSSFIRILNCIVKDFRSGCVYLGNNATSQNLYSEVIGNTFIMNGLARQYGLESGGMSRVIKNTFISSGEMSIAVEDANGGFGAHDSIISDNTIVNYVASTSYGGGIYLYSARNNLIDRNVIFNGSSGGGGTVAAISVIGSSFNNRITGNTVNNVPYGGIYLDSTASSNTISGNLITDGSRVTTATYDAIKIDGFANYIRDNIVQTSSGNTWKYSIEMPGNTNYVSGNRLVAGGSGTVLNSGLKNVVVDTIITFTSDENVGISTNAPSEKLEVLGNIKASGAFRNNLTVGSTTYVDANFRSQTNQVAGALTFSYCTNGVDGVDSTTVRWLFNSSGSDQTLTFPIINTGVNGWRTNVFSPVPPAITNGTIMKVILDVGGPTDTLARQTNCYVKFEYYQ